MSARQAAPGRATEHRRIVQSKVTAPPLRPGIVERPALVEHLVQATHTPVVLISAPAGYGKTTLLTLWRDRDERPFAWVSLEAADNDPVTLVATLLAAVDPFLRLDAAVGDALAGAEPPLHDVVLPALVDAFAEAPSPFVLVLDDLHLIREQRSHTVIGYLCERLPPGRQVALAARADPSLALASLRAHGELEELRAA